MNWTPQKPPDQPWPSEPVQPQDWPQDPPAPQEWPLKDPDDPEWQPEPAAAVPWATDLSGSFITFWDSDTTIWDVGLGLDRDQTIWDLDLLAGDAWIKV